MNFNIKKFTGLVIFPVFAAGILLIFTNAGSTSTLDNAKLEIISLNTQTQDTAKSPAEITFLKARRSMILSFISREIVARNCETILPYEPSGEAGLFEIFPSGDVKSPQLVICDRWGRTFPVSDDGRVDGYMPGDMEAAMSAVYSIILDDE